MSLRPKDIALLIAILFGAVSAILAINAKMEANKYKRYFENEMAFRLDMEERVSKLRSEKSESIAQLKDKELEIQANKKLNEKINNIIEKQGEEINNLRSELRTMKLLKEKLEENLKEELAKQESSM